MSNGSESNPDQPEPAQKLLYHATGKLYRYLAKFAGEDPDEIQQAYQESFRDVTADADPVTIGDAIGEGIDLGFSLAERRRALRQYHDELVRRELAPPAYDTERIEKEDGELAGLRVLVSEAECQFFTSAEAESKLLVRTPDGGEIDLPLEFEPGPVEFVASGETVSEVIVRPIDWSSTESTEAGPETTQYADEANDVDAEDDSLENEYLEVAREVVIEDPGRALLAYEDDESSTGRLVGKLLERKPSVAIEAAPVIIHEAIRRVGLDALEERYDELIEADTPPEIEGESGE